MQMSNQYRGLTERGQDEEQANRGTSFVLITWQQSIRRGVRHTYKGHLF